MSYCMFFFFSSRRRHTRCSRDWSSDVCSSDLVCELSRGEMEWTDGMLYPVLHRLEKERLIESEWRSAESGRERKYYRLSQDGRRAFKAEKQQWLRVHNTLGKLWKLNPVSI